MAILPIVTYNDEVLFRKADLVREITPQIETLIDDMFDTMDGADGVGLAAPQVGHSIRLFVMNADGMYDDASEADKQLGDLVLINPEIIWRSQDTVPMEEGCLSLPGLRDEVVRASTITVRYLDESFIENELTLDGWNARVVLHEMDHLDGVLFIDRLSAFRRVLHRSALEHIQRGDVTASYPILDKEE